MFEKTCPGRQSLSNYPHSVCSRKFVRITEVDEFRMTSKYPLRSSCKVLSFGTKMVYKTLLNHKINNIARKLSGDIETNPGPFVVDPSKKNSCSI